MLVIEGDVQMAATSDAVRASVKRWMCGVAAAALAVPFAAFGQQTEKLSSEIPNEPIPGLVGLKGAPKGQRW